MTVQTSAHSKMPQHNIVNSVIYFPMNWLQGNSMCIDSKQLTRLCPWPPTIWSVKVCEKYGIYRTHCCFTVICSLDSVCRYLTKSVGGRQIVITVAHTSILISSVALYGVLFGLYSSCIGIKHYFSVHLTIQLHCAEY